MDIQHAKAEAAMMLQSHGINPGKEMAQDDNTVSKSTMQGGQSQNNLFAKKKENLEDKARILELINNLEESNQHILIHKLEIRSLKDQVIKLLEERHQQSAAQLMGNV